MNIAIIGGIVAIVIGIAVVLISGQAPEEIVEEGYTELISDKVTHLPDSQGVIQNCSGTARCFLGMVTRVIDGDTIQVEGQLIRLALVSAPELDEPDGDKAKDYVGFVCPIGSSVIVDEDDMQTGGSYGRVIGVVYCNGNNLNESILEDEYGVLTRSFCGTSEFAGEAWAVRNGC